MEITQNQAETLKAHMLRDIDNSMIRARRSAMAAFLEDNPPRIQHLNDTTVIEISMMADYEYTRVFLSSLYRLAGDGDKKWYLYPNSRPGYISIASMEQ